MKALVVYNSNPAAIAPDFLRVIEGFKREDLFVVVLEHFKTDTADYADWILPATTQLEHWDVHFSYGHLYASLNKPAIAPVGEALPNTEIFRRVAAKMGLEHECLRDDDVTLVKQALDSQAEAMQGLSFEELEKHGWLRLNLPKPYTPFAKGGFRTPSGKCEFFSQRMADMGLDPCPPSRRRTSSRRTCRNWRPSIRSR